MILYAGDLNSSDDEVRYPSITIGSFDPGASKAEGYVMKGRLSMAGYQIEGVSRNSGSISTSIAVSKTPTEVGVEGYGVTPDPFSYELYSAEI
jgi:hypothetical protein